MKKSQLRRLAVDFADDRLAADAYRQRRRTLIDRIVSGEQSIERGVPGDGPLPAALEPERTRAPFPWHLVFGAAAAVCVLALLWLVLAPEDDPPAALPPPVVRAPPPTDVPRSRTLVESFLALRDFSSPAIERFGDEWRGLEEIQRHDARDESWFRSLVRTLRDEIKTQKALAGLTDGGAALIRARELLALGELLQVAGELPDLNVMPPPAAGMPTAVAAVPEPPAPVAAAGSPMPAAAPEPPAPAPVAAATPEPSAADAVPGPETAPTAREWLQAQPDDALTLQIFAVNYLDRVQQLIAANPQLPMYIVATRGGTPRYRVFHGVYTDEAAARAGFDALPSDVMRAAEGAIVKSFTTVREDLQRQQPAPGPAPAAPTARAPEAAPDVAGTSAEPGPQAGLGYTLQLFASGSRTNAQALVDGFPQLALELFEVSGESSPYRVVYGRFPSAQAARNAAATLPDTLLARIGNPLPKPVTGPLTGPRPGSIPGNGVTLR